MYDDRQDTQPQSKKARSTVQLPADTHQGDNPVDVAKNSAERDMRLGEQLGNYQLVRLLAEGGFAEIYLGEHVHLGTEAAIKVLHTQIALSDLGWFRQEARIVARLRHPHIISILDFNVQNGTPFLVMDYAPNGTLRQRHPRGAMLSPATITPYLRQISDALQYAHDRYLVHRDVKPENMLIGESGDILLSDFGIAVMLQTAQAKTDQRIIGTISYMSPEQLKGQVLAASDQYALATVVYEWLCGQCPFTGTVAEIATQHLNSEPPSLCQYNSQVPPALERVIFRALAKDPEQRYPSIREFARAFIAASPQQVLLLREAGVQESLIETVPGTNYEETIYVPPPNEQEMRHNWQSAQGRQKRASRRGVLLGLAGLATFSIAGGALLARANPSLLSLLFPHQQAVIVKPTQLPKPGSVPIGKLLISYTAHTNTVSSVAWSPQRGLYIASGSWDQSVRVWRTSTGVDVRNYTGHNDQINAVAWSPDGQKIASASNDNTVKLWNALQEGGTSFAYWNHQRNVNAVTWSPDGQMIASASDDRTVRLWRPDGTDIGVFTRHNDSVRTVGWSPDGKYLASGSADTTVYVWMPQSLNGGNNNNGDNGNNNNNGDNGDNGNHNNNISGMNASNWLDRGTPIATFSEHNGTVNTLAWSPNGQLIASAGDDRTVRIWYGLSGGSSILTYSSHNGAINAIAWSPDGTRIASASDDGTVRIWHAKDGSDVYTYNGHSQNTPSAVHTVAWSPDGKTLVSGGADKIVQIWSAG